MSEITKPGSANPAKPVLAGFFGAMAPNLLQATTQAASSRGGALLVTQVAFWVGAIMAASLGALLVYFYDERSPKRAMTLGAAAPALILGLANGLPQHAQDADAGHADEAAASASAGDSTSHPAAFVQPAALGSWAMVQGQGIRAVVRVNGLQYASHLDLVAIVGGVDARHYHLTQPGTTLALPQNTTQLYVSADGSESNRVPLSRVTGGSLTVTVNVELPAVRGFARAFGIHDAGSLKVSVTVAGAGSRAQGRPPERPSGATTRAMGHGEGEGVAALYLAPARAFVEAAALRRLG